MTDMCRNGALQGIVARRHCRDVCVGRHSAIVESFRSTEIEATGNVLNNQFSVVALVNPPSKPFLPSFRVRSCDVLHRIQLSQIEIDCLVEDVQGRLWRCEIPVPFADIAV